MGEVHYMYEMPLVFKCSKINLNITLRSIRNGIPLRAMDIMGAGGFLLTNHQNDFAMHFVDGEDYVLFGDDCYISQKGIVIDSNDKVRTIHTSVSDSDMGCFRACPPYVLGESGKTHRIEEMMSEVWLNQSVSGISKDVYHKNGNICDNDLSNLEIVEYNTPESKEESENWKKWRDAENIRLSSHI